VARVRARQHRTAVDLLYQAIFGQHLKIASDGHVRDAELLREIADPCTAVVSDGLQNQ
jgi:hypothetical protein